MEVLAYAPAAAAAWDELVARAPMATLLHTRRYLSYHGARFQDVSLVLQDEQARFVGVLPAAVDPHDESRVVSHPGVTYGGVVHDGRLRGARMLEALAAVRRHYAPQGFTTPDPPSCHRAALGEVAPAPPRAARPRARWRGPPVAPRAAGRSRGRHWPPHSAAV